jgi:hypothetical protein
MRSSNLFRRLLVIAFVVAAFTLVLGGCTSIERACDMAPVTQTARVAESGRVVVSWVYGQQLTTPNWYGEAYPLQGEVIIRMKGEPPAFDDVCGLARLGHEVAHGMGAKHQ